MVHQRGSLMAEPLSMHVPSFAKPVQLGFNLVRILGANGPRLFKAKSRRTAALMLFQPLPTILCESDLDCMCEHASHNVESHESIV